MTQRGRVHRQWPVAIRPDPHPVDVLAEVQVAVLVTEDRPLVLQLRGGGDRSERGHAARVFA